MGKSKKVEVGTWYYVATHFLLGLEADAVLAWHVGDKTAWSGRITGNGAVTVNQPNLLGGEKDQGGVAGTLRVEFGADDQLPNAYMTSVFGNKTVAWRGFTTVAWEGGKYGANNPYPQPSSFTGEWIKAMWEGGCWYAEKAAIPFALDSAINQVIQGVTYSKTTDQVHELVAPSDVSGWSPAESDYATEPSDFWPHWQSTVDGKVGMAWAHFAVPSSVGAAFTVAIEARYNDSGRALAAGGGATLLSYEETGAPPHPDRPSWSGRALVRITPVGGPLSAWVCFACVDGRDISTGNAQGSADPSNPDGHTMTMSASLQSGEGAAMNPAHILYYLQTQPGRGSEPLANMDDANLRAAADWFYAQGFGLCGTRKAASESPADYIRKIEQVAGCSFVRSPVSGQWRIHIANGEYDVESLPVLTDDDVLSFKETPTVLGEAINSVSVRYFDPLKRQTITTAPVRALALIASFGERHQTLDYPEIPTAALANRVALRELLSFITPTRKFELDTKTTTDSYERGQYFRLQLAKRGIADMVCEVGEIQYGKLQSGGNRLVAVQDTIRMPDGVYIEPEPGVDTRPPQVALPIVAQAAFEAPWVEVCQRLPRAELALLPADVGYLVAVAADPGTSRDFTLMAAPDGGDYEEAGDGDFCPTATVTASAGYTSAGPFALASAKRLADVQVGDPVLWDLEVCRVDAIDTVGLTVTLGRGCADTVRQQHAAGSRLYFYADGMAYDETEYTDGELVHAKLLTNTGSARLSPDDAAELDIAIAGRPARPYPPAAVEINGESYPATLIGDAVITWRHRDRLQQADQLVDQTMASIGPEPGTTYTVRNVDVATDTETHIETGITGTTWTVPAADLAGANRLEVYSVRDGLESLYRVSVAFGVGSVLQAEDGNPILTEDGQIILME